MIIKKELPEEVEDGQMMDMIIKRELPEKSSEEMEDGQMMDMIIKRGYGQNKFQIKMDMTPLIKWMENRLSGLQSRLHKVEVKANQNYNTLISLKSKITKLEGSSNDIKYIKNKVLTNKNAIASIQHTLQTVSKGKSGCVS